MVKVLLLIGLAVTPFILAPGHSDIAREPKMAWAIVFSLAIALVSLYKGELKAFKNKWAFVLVGFCLLSFYMSPNPELKLFGIESGRFWSWEPLYQGIVFLLFTISVASIKFERKMLDNVFAVMTWCGTLMASFVILQSFHIDQFFIHLFGTYGNMAGTLGNPNLVGPFLCVILPIALYQRKWVMAALMIAGVLVTRCDVSTIGLIAVLATYYGLKGGNWTKCVLVLGTICVLVIGGLYMTKPEFRAKCPDNQRFLTWSQSIGDVTSPVMNDAIKNYSITGIGPGSFKYLFHAKHNVGEDAFVYAHNDFVQVIYECGFAGFIIFMGMLFAIFRRTTTIKDIFIGRIPYVRRALITALVGSLVCACGVFTLQIGTHIFYTLTVIGLLYNDTV